MSDFESVLVVFFATITVVGIFLMRTLDKLKETSVHAANGWDRARKLMERALTAEKDLRLNSINRRYMERLLDRSKEALEGMTQERDRVKAPRRLPIADLDSHLFDPMSAPQDGHGENKL